MKVEICTNSFESAQNAQKAGADRIELCTELAVGGLTPSYGLIQKVMSELTIPVNVLIRPRGGHFHYSETELDVMLRDVEFCKEMGCNGIVSGALLPDNNLDILTTNKLIEASGNLEFTFHRAFDQVPNPEETIKKLKRMGVRTILTSGQASSAFDGLDHLVSFQNIAGDEMAVMPGGGIHEENIIAFTRYSFPYIHFSGTVIEKSDPPHQVEMHSLKLFDENSKAVSSPERLAQMIQKVKV